MSVAEESTGTTTMVNEMYEFSSPRFFDFIKGESDKEMRKAKLWFDSAPAYAPSSSMPRITTDRTIKVESLCNFSEAAEQMQKASESSYSTVTNCPIEMRPQAEVVSSKAKESEEATSTETKEDKRGGINAVCAREDKLGEIACAQVNGSVKLESAGDKERSKSSVQVGSEVCNPKPMMTSQKGVIGSKKQQKARKKWFVSALDKEMCKAELWFDSAPAYAPTPSMPRITTGRTFKVESVCNFSEAAEQMQKASESAYSTAAICPLEMKPQAEVVSSKAKESEEATSTETKEDKSRGIIAILEAPSLPAVQRSAQPPEFQEFHFETMAQANRHAETSSVALTEVVSCQNNQGKPNHQPKSRVLHTFLRARPPKVKRSAELEPEELEKAPKFRANPLNKKIFEIKGEPRIFCNAKKHVTIPQEFHLHTNERIPLPSSLVDLFDKLSLNSEPRHDKPLPRNTTPNPFHLYTEERGAEKEMKFVMEVRHKQLEEEHARIPKATPFPRTTDYPVFPPKPVPKHCTKAKPFQLESLVRHEEEMRRKMEERLRKECEEAQMRKFKARPVLQEDPILVREKVRKPLTKVHGFNLHSEHRAVDRAEFDKKFKEKEVMYKRNREESDTALMLVEEKALKQLRRTVVHHARPVPNFQHPFCPQKSSKETTKAKSPQLRVLQRTERRKLMSAFTSV